MSAPTRQKPRERDDRYQTSEDRYQTSMELNRGVSEELPTLTPNLAKIIVISQIIVFVLNFINLLWNTSTWGDIRTVMITIGFAAPIVVILLVTVLMYKGE